MSLDAGRYREHIANPGAVLTYRSADCTVDLFAQWLQWEPTELLDHGTPCCNSAREWLASLDLASLNGGSRWSGPRWIRQRYNWGPSIHPAFWCEAVRSETVDCGIHAAFAHETFTARGVRSSRVQLVQQFSFEATKQWRAKWENVSAVTAWINGRNIYHEGCALINAGDEVRIWDPSGGWWLDPATTEGYGATRALRIVAPRQMTTFSWGRHEIPANRWSMLEQSHLTA